MKLVDIKELLFQPRKIMVVLKKLFYNYDPSQSPSKHNRNKEQISNTLMKIKYLLKYLF